MKKPWSVSTTVRNPERLVGLLKVLNMLDGEPWNNSSQIKFQVLLIQHREYGFGNTQFYNGLPKSIISVIDDVSQDISYKLANDAFIAKKYEDPPMRGRQSINPLTKLGFALIKDGKVMVTELGKKAIAEEIDMGNAFLRCFLKWQIPNPASKDYSLKDGYNINPFIGTIRLIDRVNALEKERGNKPVGLQKREFALFVPTLINYIDIDKYARKILYFRDIQEGHDKTERKQIRDNYRYDFAKEFLGTENSTDINKLLANLTDYGDNAIRYFRLTRFFHIRGGGYYVDIEPRRAVEIREILSNYTGESIIYSSYGEYAKFISTYELPVLPWETRSKRMEIAKLILQENENYVNTLGIQKPERKELNSLTDDDLIAYITELRTERFQLQEQLRHIESQQTEELEQYINVLNNIFSYDDRPLNLEKYVTLGLHALNDAISIKPNYPVGDDNEPTFTAPRGVPDIECYYDSFNAICEVTMQRGRDQWVNEGQPVMRHLRDFEDRVMPKGTATYCLFIAPSIHRDTLNTFWFACKYEYEGSQQKIIPITITQFTKVLEALLQLKKKCKTFTHNDLMNLYNAAVDDIPNINSSDEWLIALSNNIDCWINNITKQTG